MARVAERFAELRPGLAREVDVKRPAQQNGGHWGQPRVDGDVRHAHRQERQGLVAYVRHGSAGSLLTAPVAYSLLLPLAVLDIWVSVYQRVCFPVYGIPCVTRQAYFAMDRRTLGYLNAIEKVHCTFCSYANGVIGYVREVAARTEQYWCPIKHARAIPAPHRRYASFLAFGDADGYRQRLTALRGALRPTVRSVRAPHREDGRRGH